MKIKLQLLPDNVDPESPLLLKAAPGLNAHIKNGLSCVHALRREHHIFYSRFSRKVITGQKYSSKTWKSARFKVLEGDGCQCMICDRKEGLQIHQIDIYVTSDNQSDLVRLGPCWIAPAAPLTNSHYVLAAIVI